MSEDVDPEDLRLFRKMTANVSPIAQNRVLNRQSPPDPIPIQTNLDEKRVIDELLMADPGIDIETGDELCYARAGMQHRVVKKLKRGQYTVKAVLDLHGLYVRDAHNALITFLQSSQAYGNHCVRIIHGKGHRSPQGRPIIKKKIYHWLKQRDEVLAFCSAKRNDGGTGAIYVLLKR